MNGEPRVGQPMDIELQIEELVLHGAGPVDRDALAAQLIAALRPVLSARGLGAWFDGALAGSLDGSLDGTVVEHMSARLAAPRAGAPEATGTAVGHAIGDALTRPR